MRRAAKVDDNQAEVVAALRKAGATVQTLHTIGHGCPDLLVGYRQTNLLMEVKDGAKPPSARKLTDDERDWIAAWRAPVYIVNGPIEAVAVIQTVRP